jgi:uncharacterized protein YdeI (BOF family)
MRNSKKLILAFSMLAIAIAFTGSAFAADKMGKMDKMAADKHTSTKFEGPKANAGTVTHSKKDGKNVLTLSEDFVVPDTPDPHWQIVDSKGTVYLLDRLKLKGDKIQTSITVPAYVKDVAKVQIWCAFAEANLGEASFSTPVK